MLVVGGGVWLGCCVIYVLMKFGVLVSGVRKCWYVLLLNVLLKLL